MKALKLSLVMMCLILLANSHALGFSTHNTTISRTFDTVETGVDGSITVTVDLTNSEVNDLRGFYYAEHVSQGLTVSTISVKIDGNDISNYLFESGSVEDVYPNYIPYRWTLETPTTFDENNTISSGSTVEIVYSVSSGQEGTFHFDEFNWVGYYQNTPVGERAAFGHSEADDQKTITFTSDNTDSGCFIATAAYGSRMETHIKILCEFRDRFLLTNAAGKSFVDLYYTYSPPVADFITRHDMLQAPVRWALLPIVAMTCVMLHFGPALALVFMFALFALMIATVHKKFTHFSSRSKIRR